ncbi:MAG: ComEC/Rec2 family competence protein [Caldicoprobacterales bacterium]|jgi:competence protein ComEC|nr:MBL fold metallo-hydrolase [Clostridiales bacterium]
MDNKLKGFNKKFPLILVLLVITLSLLSACDFLLDDLYIEGDQQEQLSVSGQDLIVHFIDVGQGDSILVQLPNQQNMLIDAGDNDKGQVVVDYIEKQGVSRIDYLIATHPHADHIGGMDHVIDHFEIGDIYMPKVAHTTKTYMDLLEAIDRKNLKIRAAQAGMDITIDDVRADILAPDSQLKSDNLNDYSIVIKLTYGQTVFLLQGDAERKTEEAILTSGIDVEADVIKLGHHGSTTSSTSNYIDAVDPDYAIVSAGEGNKYGHPHKEVVALMKEKGIILYRTDRDGTIVAISDGSQISFNK